MAKKKYVFDISKVEIARGYSYPEICQLQGWKVDSKGKSVKENQLKAMAEECNFHTEGIKKGMKYIIDSFKTGLDYEKIREELKGHNLQSLIQRSIIEQLKNQIIDMEQGDVDSWYVTKKELYNAIGVHSRHRDHVVRNLVKFSEKYKLDRECVNDIVDNNRRYIRDNVNRALRSLEYEHGLIHKTDSYVIVVKECVGNIELIAEQGTGVVTEVERRINATSDITSFIKTSVIPNVKQELRIKNLNILKYDRELRSRFWRRIPEWINEHSNDLLYDKTPKYSFDVQQLTNCVAVYECYRIAFSQEVIQKECSSNESLSVEELNLIEVLFSLSELGTDNKETITDLLDTLFAILEKNARNRKSEGYTNEKYTFRVTDDYDKASHIVNRECHSNRSSYTNFNGRRVKKETKIRRTIVAPELFY